MLMGPEKNSPGAEVCTYERLKGGVCRWLGPSVSIHLREVSSIWLSIEVLNSAQNFCIKQFSIECRKTRIKEITLANHKLKDMDNPVNRSKLKVITCS